MSSKRRSLADLIKEDADHGTTSVVPIRAKTEEPLKVQNTEEPATTPTEIRNPKSDFIKMSITVPPEMFEDLQDASRRRRRAKKSYTMSDLVRDAIGDWLTGKTSEPSV